MRNNEGFTLIELAIIVAIIGVLATIAIYQYHVYVTKANNVTALTELRHTMEAMEGYYADNKEYTDQWADVEKYLGHNPNMLYDVEVTLELPDGNDQRYMIVAAHKSGNKRYVVTGPGGPIDGQPK